MSTQPPPLYVPPAHRRRALSSADFDTASVRSAAPSYFSEAPSYRSSVPSQSSSSSRAPSLNDFRIPTWSTTRANPTARHYHSVAQRRATVANAKDEQAMMAAAMAPNPVAAVMKIAEEREREEYEGRLRPEEDPDLVGPEAAELARKKRLGKWGNDVLVREDRRWDWLIGQMADWEERDKSWAQFRAEVESGKRTNLASRLGIKKGGRA